MGQPDVRSGPAPPEGEVSGHSKSNGADVRRRPQQARRSAAAPWREETAEALRCGAAWRASWPSAAGRESKPQPWGVLAKPTARTCGSVPSKRGVQPPLRGAKRQRRHSAVGQPGVRPGPAPPEGEVNLSPGGRAGLPGTAGRRAAQTRRCCPGPGCW